MNNKNSKENWKEALEKLAIFVNETLSDVRSLLQEKERDLSLLKEIQDDLTRGSPSKKETDLITQLEELSLSFKSKYDGLELYNFMLQSHLDSITHNNDNSKRSIKNLIETVLTNNLFIYGVINEIRGLQLQLLNQCVELTTEKANKFKAEKEKIEQNFQITKEETIKRSEEEFLISLNKLFSFKI